jgi:hypothetical protein
MNRLFLVVLMSLIISGNPLLAGPSSMVEKHIFTPEKTSETRDESQPAPGVISSALEKDILFAGVIISKKGKFAIVRENAKNDKAGPKQLLKQGDQIKGMTIQEIGPNFVLLTGKENSTVKMALYKGAKTRPAPPPVEAKPEMIAGGADQIAPKKEKPQDVQPQQQGAPAAEKELPGVFGGGASKGHAQPQQQSGPPPVNPFADMFNSAGQRSPTHIPTNPFNQLPINQ